jgi:hypothetical protein
MLRRVDWWIGTGIVTKAKQSKHIELIGFLQKYW